MAVLPVTLSVDEGLCKISISLKMLQITAYRFLILLLISQFISGCSNCSKYGNEQYSDSLYTLKPFSNILDSYDDINEPDLANVNYEAYRLFFSHSFDSTQHIISILKSDKGCILKSIEIQTKLIDELRSTQIIARSTKELTTSRWNEIENLIYKSNYWTLEQTIDREGFDGAIFILEGSRPQAKKCNKRAYHIIERWSPEPGPLRDVCDSLLLYSGYFDRTH